VIEIVDDGRGICRESVVQKAVEKGLIQQDQSCPTARYCPDLRAWFLNRAEGDQRLGAVLVWTLSRRSRCPQGRIEVRSEPGKGAPSSLGCLSPWP